MSRMVETLAELDQALGDLVRESYETGAQRSLSDDEVLTITALAGRIVRHGEALAIDATAQIQERCEYSSHDERVTTRKGARSVSELLQRATLASKQTVAGYERAARAISRNRAPSSGMARRSQSTRPPRFRSDASTPRTTSASPPATVRGR